MLKKVKLPIKVEMHFPHQEEHRAKCEECAKLWSRVIKWKNWKKFLAKVKKHN